MPITLDNPDNPKSFPGLLNKDLGYSYADGLDLRPGSQLHGKIVHEVMRRAQAGHDVIQDREPTWKNIDRSLTAYVPLTNEESIVKSRDSRKPVAIVVPLSYAVLETILTYWVSKFFTKPYFKYSGRGPEDIIGAALLELVIQSHVDRYKVPLAEYTQWRDAFAYGFGVVVPKWKVLKGRKPINTSGILSGMMDWFRADTKKQETYESIVFEGNELETIDPRQYLPDATVPIDQPQRGEFVGWIVRSNYATLLSEERISEGAIFNTRYLRDSSISGESVLWQDRGEKTNSGTVYGSKVTDTVDTIYMYVKLIPDEWGLSKNQYPETWLFAVSSDDVVRQAMQVDLLHDMFPVAVIAPDADGHSALPVSKLEVSYGLQEIVDWLINTNIQNVRKSLNDMWVVDPMRINIEDMRDPRPGKIIRTNKPAWGTGVKDAIMQFPVSDVTQQHINNIPVIADLLYRCTGASDIIQGVIQTHGERRSAQEMRDVKSGAVSRLDKGAKIGALQSRWDIAYMFAKNTQQFMSNEIMTRINGNTAAILESEYGIQHGDLNQQLVRPGDLLVDFDVVIEDGNRTDEADPQFWLGLLQLASGSPEISQRVDILRLFLHAARLGGARDVFEFIRKGGNMSVVPMADEQIQGQVQKGNMVPLGDYNASVG